MSTILSTNWNILEHIPGVQWCSYMFVPSQLTFPPWRVAAPWFHRGFALLCPKPCRWTLRYIYGESTDCERRLIRRSPDMLVSWKAMGVWHTTYFTFPVSTASALHTIWITFGTLGTFGIPRSLDPTCFDSPWRLVFSTMSLRGFGVPSPMPGTSQHPTAASPLWCSSCS